MNIVLFALLVCLGQSFLTAADEPLTTIFAHGLADTHHQASLWQAAHPHLHIGPIVAPDFPDATERFWRVNFPWTSLGQDNEIATFKDAVEHYQSEHAGKKTILEGLSRGAATVINYTALYQPQDIGALILISPFPSMRKVAQNIIDNSRLKDIPYARELAPYAVGSIFWQYSDSGIHPIDVVTQIDPRIPILFISLEHDHLIPSHLTQELVDALVHNGHTRVHHLILKEGRHGKPIPGKEGKKVQRVTQAFLHYYNLPCNPHCARKGLKDFAATCPNLQTILKNILK